MSYQPNEFTGIFIPADIWLDKKFKFKHKVILAMRQEGFSVEEIAEALRLSLIAVKRNLKAIEKLQIRVDDSNSSDQSFEKLQGGEK